MPPLPKPSMLAGVLLLASILFEMPPVLQAADILPSWPGSQHITIGRTNTGEPLIASGHASALDPAAKTPLLVIAFPAFERESPHSQAVQSFLTAIAKSGEERLRMVAVPLSPTSTFPPTGTAYNTEEQRTASTIWRAIGWLGASAVMEIRECDFKDWPATSLATAVRAHSVAGLGTTQSACVPASLLLKIPPTWTPEERAQTGLLELSPILNGKQIPPLRLEFDRRNQCSAEQVARALTTVYGHDLKKVMYQPALAIIARRQFVEQFSDPSVHPAIEKILTPYLENSTAKIDPNGSVVSGHLVFADWALKTKDARAIELVRRAADVGFDADGSPLKSMPSHNEMSDSVFMGCPILAAAARLTGESKYLDQLLRHYQFIKQLDLRDDGLYRHSPLCEAAWGRGNGFPMLGLSLSLTHLAAIVNDPAQPAALREKARRVFDETLPDFKALATALLQHQDKSGMWRQVIDEPAAYREMTATCMIGYALQRGLNAGWLDAKTFQPAADRAWQAILPRISDKGVLLDVCTGTGKQKSLEDYFNRTAIFDVDERGGAMALIFAVERLPQKTHR